MSLAPSTTSKSMSPADRLQSSELIVRALRSGEPLLAGLGHIANDSRGRVSKLARSLQQAISSGASLQSVLASGESPDARSLRASIDAGIKSDRLDAAFESWVSLHRSRAAAATANRGKLVYPLALIPIATVSVAYSIHQLVPQFVSQLQSIHRDPPWWIWFAILIHRNLIAWAVSMIALECLPFAYFVWRQRSYDSRGWPRNKSYQLMLQSHLCRMASMMFSASLPLAEIADATVRATGITDAPQDPLGYLKEIARGFTPNALNTPIPQACAVLIAMAENGIETDNVLATFDQLAESFSEQADAQVLSQTQWIPAAIGVMVASSVGASYLLAIYLPWMLLMDELKSFHLID